MSHKLRVLREQIEQAARNKEHEGGLDLVNQTELGSVKSTLEAAVAEEAKKRGAMDTKIRKDFKAADAKITEAFGAADASLTEKLEELSASMVERFAGLQVSWVESVDGAYKYASEAPAPQTGDRFIVKPLGDSPAQPEDPFNGYAGYIAQKTEGGWDLQEQPEGNCVYNDASNLVQLSTGDPATGFVDVAKFVGEELATDAELKAAVDSARKDAATATAAVASDLEDAEETLRAEAVAEFAAVRTESKEADAELGRQIATNANQINKKVDAHIKNSGKLNAQQDANIQLNSDRTLSNKGKIESNYQQVTSQADKDRAFSMSMDKTILKIMDRRIHELEDALYSWETISGDEKYECDFGRSERHNFVMQPLSADVVFRLPDEGRFHRDRDYTKDPTVERCEPTGRCDLEGSQIILKLTKTNGYSVTVSGGNIAIDGNTDGYTLDLDDACVTFIHAGAMGWIMK